MTINYYVIGGQYNYYNHGGAETLLGAKRKAAACMEYWDNWQGWHRPAIYAANDCHETTSIFYGAQMTPKPDAIPIAVWNGKQWVEPER